MVLKGLCAIQWKASNLPVSMMRQFLHSKLSYTRFTLATCTFKSMKAFARSKFEIWCIDLVYIEKLSKDSNGVKYLPARQDVFGRTVDAKNVKAKDSKETVVHFWLWLQKKSTHQNLGRKQSLLESLKNVTNLKNTTLPYNGWDYGCLCLTYNAILEKCVLPLLGRLGIQVNS